VENATMNLTINITTTQRETENENKTSNKYVHNSLNMPYHDVDAIYRRRDRKCRGKQQFKIDGDLVDSSDHEKGMKHQLTEQSLKHAAYIEALKKTQMPTQHIFTQKFMSLPTVQDCKISQHVTSITKPSETLFDGKPEYWPTFESRLLNIADNPTIELRRKLPSLKLLGQGEPIKFLETYVSIPGNMTSVLIDDLKHTKEDEIKNFESQLFKLNALRTKRHNCLTPEFGHGVETPTAEGITNKDDRIFFIILVARTFHDKVSHKHIICKYIMKIEITTSTPIESFQRESSMIQGNE
jgi:hypothetical protein